MRFFLKVIFVILSFTLEIKVKAAIVYREPVQCEQSKSTECLIFSGNIGGKIQLPGAEFFLGHETLMYRDLQNHWHLLRGVVKVIVNTNTSSNTQLRFSNFPNFEVNTLVGKFESQNAVYLLQISGERTHLFVLSGKVMPVMNSPVSSSFFLTAGYANWYSTINTTGFNVEGYPRPLLWKKFVTQIGFENWYLILNEKHKVKNNELASVENSSKFYLEIVQQMEQFQLDKENFEEKRQRAIASEAMTVRQLFRKKFEIESIDE